MLTIWQDVRFALRTAAKRPGFALFAILILSLGIAANTTVFSLANAVLLEPLPYRDANRLMMVWEDASFIGFPMNTPAPGNYAEWKARNHTFDDIAALAGRTLNLTSHGEPTQVTAVAATSNLFSVLGVSPTIGRSFSAEEDQPGVAPVTVLSYGLWVRQFGADREVLDRQILLNDTKFTVIGVMPKGFVFPEREAEMWVPAQFSSKELANHGSHYLRVVGRLKPEVSLVAANADLASIAKRLVEENPEENTNVGAYAMPLREYLTGESRLPILVLLSAVAFVLLIACANVANLTLARATGRRRELAVRIALGAGRRDMIRQLLTESLLLSTIAGIAGLLLSVWGFVVLKQLVPSGIAKIDQISLDWRLLVFTLVVSTLTGILFGLIPAIRGASIPVNETLKQAGDRGAVGAAGNRVRNVLVISEVALAVVLLSGAGLLIKSFFRMRGLDLGFRTDNVLVMETELPRPRYDEFARRTAFYDEVLARVTQIPGIKSAGYTTWLPYTNRGGTRGFTIEGKPQPKPGEIADANTRVISTEYLQTLGVPLKEGRLLERRDSAHSVAVMLINETMAKQFWPDQNPIGKRIKMGDYDSSQPWVTIVGIVGDMKQMGFDLPPRAEMYFPYQQQSFYSPGYLAVKTADDETLIAGAVRAAIWSVDKEQPIDGVMPLAELVNVDLAPRELQAKLLGGLAGFALLLAALGIYAVLSFSVAQRTQEIGLRMALGAAPAQVLRSILGEGMKLVVLGMLIGVMASLVLARLLGHLLFGLSVTDPQTFIGVGILLGAAAFAACYVPAQRATCVDPMVALRYE